MMKKILIIIGIILFLVNLVYAQEQENIFVYDSKGKIDPFISLVSPEGYLINTQAYSETSEISLEGIIYDPAGSSFAIINGEVVKVGDTIGGFDILEIQKNRVILLKDNERAEIELREGK